MNLSDAAAHVLNDDIPPEVKPEPKPVTSAPSPQPILRLERWESSENQSEIHFFNGQTYIFGYNPIFVSNDQARAILVHAGFDVEEVANLLP